MVSADERDGNSEEARAACKSVFVVVFVPEYVVDAADPRDHAGERERLHPHPTDIDPAVLRRFGLEPNCPQLVATPRAKEIEPDCRGNEKRDNEREIRGRSMEPRIDVGEPRQNSGVNLRSVERLRNVQMPGDKPVEQREHDEVEHDRHDHLVRAESGLQICGYCTDDSSSTASRDHAEQQRNDEWCGNRKHEGRERSRKPARRELALSTDVEKPGTKTE